MMIEVGWLIGVVVSMYAAIIGAYVYINARITQMDNKLETMTDAIVVSDRHAASELLIWRLELVERLARIETAAIESREWRKELVERLKGIDSKLEKRQG